MNKTLKERMQKENFHYVSIDLFSGPGGLCVGFKWAGILPLIAVEWVNSTAKTYSLSHDAEIMHLENYIKDNDYLKHFLRESTKTLLIHGDINHIDGNLIKKLLFHRYGIDSINETVDIVSGGAPCESFSLAGVRTVGDIRDNLFNNIIRISKTLNTKAILFENVKGILSKTDINGKKGAIFNEICNAFEEETIPKYCLISRKQDEILLKASDFGVPQDRERLFLISIRSDLYNKGIKFAYPMPTHGPNKTFPYVTVSDALSDLPIVNSNEEAIYYNPPTKYNSPNQQRYIKIMRGIEIVDKMDNLAPAHLKYDKNSLSSHKGPGHTIKKQALLSIIPPNSSMKEIYKIIKEKNKLNDIVPKFSKFTYKDVFPNTIYTSRNRRLKNDYRSYTVTSHCLDELLHPTLIEQ